MIEVGIIGLDTSHAEEFAEIISDREDAIVRAVWDGGVVRDQAYVTEFCDAYGATEYDPPGEMIDVVDAAMVLTVNWDLHPPIANRFLEADVPILIDKPIAGSVEGVEEIRRAATAAPVFGGSAVPYHPSLSEMLTDDGTHDLFSAGFNSPFYYGVHLTDTARKICGSDWARVEPAAHHASVTITFENGSNTTIRFDGPTEDAAFGLLDVGDTVRTAHIEGNEAELERMYGPFIDAFVATVRGERESPDWLFDAATLTLAVQAALETGNGIHPDSRELFEVTKDGTAFTDGYKPLY